MYLSLLHVNVDNRPGRMWLGNLYRIHQRLWMAFPDDRRREEDPFFLATWTGPAAVEPKPNRETAGFLFRVERDGPARILVQSAEKPDWDYAFQNAPHLLDRGPKVRLFNPAPTRDQRYRFRLLANIVNDKSVPRPNAKTRTTKSGLTIARRTRKSTPVTLLPAPEILPADVDERNRIISARFAPWCKWLSDIAHGFRILDDQHNPLRMEAVHTLVRHPHWKKPQRLNAGIFDGVLICTDPDELARTVRIGIGPAKAFGFGLLSILPAG